MTLTGYKALIRDPQARVLLLEDSFTRDGVQKGFWDLPGGKPELGESPIQTVVREVKEEVDLDVIVGVCLGEYHIAARSGLIRCPVYDCTPLSLNVDITKNPAQDESILSYAWLTIDDAITRTMSRSLRRFLRSVRP